MKDDPRVQKCLEALDDISLRAQYLEEEQKLDSEIYGIPINELIEKRTEELQKTKALVRKNAAVLEKEYRHKKVQFSTSTTKKQRDQNLESFVPASETGKGTSSPQASTDFVLSKDTTQELEMARIKDKYKRIMTFRSDEKKILSVEVQMAEEDTNLTKFHVKLMREGNIVDERPRCTVENFGMTELMEMGQTFKGKNKAELSKAEIALLRRIQKKIELKVNLEKTLGIKQRSSPSPIQSPSSSSTTKRKATEEPSGHIEKK